MYTISSNLNTILHQPSRVLDVYCVIDGDTYDASKVVEYSIESNLTDDGTYKIGCATSKTLSLTLVNVDYTGWKGKEVQVYQKVCNQVGVTNPESATTYDTIPMGVFYVYDTEISKLSIKLNCFDVIALLGNENYKSTLTYPTTINNVISELSTRYNITFDKLTYSTNQIASMKASNIRQALQFIAVHLGANVGTTRSGSIAFIKPVATTFTIDGYNYTTLVELDNNAQILSNLVATIDDVTHEVGDDSGITLELMEDVVSSATELDNILTNANLPYVYRAFDIELQGMPHLDVGDIITVVDVDNVSHNVPIFTQTFTFNGGIKTKINSNPYNEDEETANGGVTSVTSAIREISADVGRINNIFANKLVADYIEVDETFANKIFAQDITATGTITGATINGGTVNGATFYAETDKRKTTISPLIMKIEAEGVTGNYTTDIRGQNIIIQRTGGTQENATLLTGLTVDGAFINSESKLYIDASSDILLSTPIKISNGGDNMYLARFADSAMKLGGSSYDMDIHGKTISFNGTLWSKLFTFTQHTTDAVTSTSSGNLQYNSTLDITKSGWLPLAVTGFDANGTGASYTFFSCVKLSKSAVGSGTITYDWRCTSTSTSKSITCQFTVLWVKAI